MPFQLGDDNNYIKHDTSEHALIIASNEVMTLESISAIQLAAPVAGGTVDETADGTIHDKRLCQIDGSGDLVEADTNTVNIAGINCEGADVSGTEAIALGLHGHFTGVADALIEGGTHLKSCSGGRVGRFITTTLAGTTMKNPGDSGGAFANQPANDGVTVVSDSAADTAIPVNIIGTTNGTDTVVEEVVFTDGTNGTTPVNSSKTDWGVILAIKTIAHAGTITVSETSGSAAIKALATGTNSAGVISVTGSSQRAFNKAPPLFPILLLQSR